MIDSYHPQLEREAAHDRSVRMLAEEALKLAPRFTRFESAVWQAIRNARVSEAEKGAMFTLVAEEARRQKRGQQAKRRVENAQRAEAEALLAAERWRNLMLGAHAHEKRQPPETWNANAEEDARRGA